jgi:hypothetical protein
MKNTLISALSAALFICIATLALAGDPLHGGLHYDMIDRQGNPAGHIAVWSDTETIFVTPAGSTTPKVYEWDEDSGKYIGVADDCYEFTLYPEKTWVYTSATSTSSVAGTMTQNPDILEVDPVTL